MPRKNLTPLKASKIAELLRVNPGSRFRLKEHRTDWRETKALRDLSNDELKEKSRAYVEQNLEFFLNISKAEQKKRFRERVTNPEKHWKFSQADLAEREHWDTYQKTFEETINATTTKWAPWYVVPSDHKWIARATVSAVIRHGIKSLGLQAPVLSAEQRKALAAARRKLLPRD